VTGDLERRVRALEDHQAIRTRLYSYGHSLDYGRRDEWLDCWIDDACLHWPDGSFTGRDAIAKAFDTHTHAPLTFHKHVIVAPVIVCEGDQARVSSYFVRIDHGPSGPTIRSFGRYLDIVVRCGDSAWRFAERFAELESRISVSHEPTGSATPPRVD
jgi:hypothetical protein